ncbi:hypothetical protein U1Q18_051393 [Sarracenia purpurea var. burkii]
MSKNPADWARWFNELENEDDNETTEYDSQNSQLINEVISTTGDQVQSTQLTYDNPLPICDDVLADNIIYNCEVQESGEIHLFPIISHNNVGANAVVNSETDPNLSESENTAECVTEKCTDDISDEESVISRDDPNYSPSKCSYSGSDSDINSDVSDEQLCDIENKEPSNVLTNGISNEIISETPKTRKRKRFAVEEEWQRNVMKKKRALGQEKIPKAQQDSLLAEYYTYGDVARQKDYICSLVSKTDVVRKRPRKMDSNVEKNWSKVYTLPNGENEKVRVCAEFFCATFAISKSVVEDAIKNKVQMEATKVLTIVKEDQRRMPPLLQQ